MNSIEEPQKRVIRTLDSGAFVVTKFGEKWENELQFVRK